MIKRYKYIDIERAMISGSLHVLNKLLAISAIQDLYLIDMSQKRQLEVRSEFKHEETFAETLHDPYRTVIYYIFFYNHNM